MRAVLAIGFVLLAAAPALAERPPIGDWIVKANRSALDGTTTATAVLASTNELSNIIGAPERASLVLRCTGPAFVAYVSVPFVVGYDHAEVRYRVDDLPVAGGYWGVSDDGTAVGFWDRGHAVSFLAALVPDRHKLVVAVSPSGKIAEEALFDLEGTEAAKRLVVTACDGGELPPPGAGHAGEAPKLSTGAIPIPSSSTPKASPQSAILQSRPKTGGAPKTARCGIARQPNGTSKLVPC